MYQTYPYYQQVAQPQPTKGQPQYPSTFGLKGRPVSSMDEVRATTVDFDGSIFFFPDLANKKIYTKQIMMDGSAVLNMYELKQMPTEVVSNNINSNNFITREEFETALSQLHEVLDKCIPKELNNNSENSFKF